MLDRRTIVGAASVCVLAAVGALAADVAVRGRRLAVRAGQGGESSRKVVIVGREASVDVPVPAFSQGANLLVRLEGQSATSQLFFLPASGWTSTARGQRFTGAADVPVEEVLVETNGTDPARVRVVLRGSAGTTPLNLLPPNLGSGGSLSLAGSGDTYCVVLGGAAGGTIAVDTALAFRMHGATAEVACPPVPTVVPTPGPTSGMCVPVCAPTVTPTPTPVPCPTAGPCPTLQSCATPQPCVTPTPVITPLASPPPPSPTPTPCPTICS